MRRALILERLKELREKHYATIPEFAKATKIHDANVRSIEAGASMPSIERMEKWTTACGLPLSEFIAQIEAIERGGKPKIEHPLVEKARAAASTDQEVANAFLKIFERMAPSSSKPR